MTTDRLLLSSLNPLALSPRPFPPPAESDRSGQDAASGSGAPAVYDRLSLTDRSRGKRMPLATTPQFSKGGHRAGFPDEDRFSHRLDATADPLLADWYRTVLSLHGVLDRTGRIVDLLA